MLLAGHVEARSRESNIGRRREIEIFAVLVEARIDRIAHPVGDLETLGLIERIRENSVLAAGKLFAVSNPLVVGGPCLVERGWTETSEIIGVN